MTILAVPLIVAAHVATLPTLDGWAADGDRAAVPVSEGAQVRRDAPREWCTVGFVADQNDAVVQFEAWTDAQNSTRDEGGIACQLITSARTVADARARLFQLLQSWAAWLATDRTLDGKLLAGSELHLAADVALGVGQRGATATAVVTITYTAMTYG